MRVKPCILVVHCLIEPHGGACGVLCWTLEALRQNFQVTLLTWHPVDLPSLNRYFGTSLQPGDFAVRYIHPAIRCFFELDPDPGSIQKSCYLMRVCKRVRSDFDLVLGCDNESDFGEPALQYVHLPQFAHVFPGLEPSADVALRRKAMALLRGRIRPWMLLANYSFDRMRSNRTMVNSDWTGRWFRRVYGVDSVTLYPPVHGHFPILPWEQRQDGFIVLGRLHPCKRSIWCLRVLEVVRRACPGIKLHIIGSTDRSSQENEYYDDVVRLASANSSWVFLHENLSREEVQDLVARQRYGLHAMKNEHFGMAVAEMLLAGCIPFVHNSGGPPEIIGYDPRLTYDSEVDAAEKILNVIQSPAQQTDIRAGLELGKDRFGSERFMSGIVGEVSRVLNL